MRKIRVAFVLPHLKTGGIEHVVLRLLTGLDRRSFTPILFLRQRSGELLARLPEDVEVHDAGGRRALSLAPRLARWLRAQSVDVVYSGTNAVNLLTLAACRLLPAVVRPRVIISEHTNAAAYLAGAKGQVLRRALIRRLYPLADLMVFPTGFLAAEWNQVIGPRHPPFRVAPNPILDPDALEAMARLPARRIAGQVICAGRLIPEKGHDLVIRALARLAPEMPDLQLKIFGEGPQRAALQQLIDDLGMSGRFTLAGLTSALLQEMASAQVLALGSQREGFGNVVVEGLAAGVRVVATDCPGPVAILDGGRYGRIVPKGDLAAMQAALRDALAGPVTQASPQELAAWIRPYQVHAAVEAFAGIVQEVLVGEPGRSRPLSKGRAAAGRRN